MLQRKKYFLCVCLCILSLFILNCPADAAARDILDVNGFAMDYKQPVLEKEEIVYVPMAETFFRIGGGVSWNGVNRLATATFNDHRIVIKPDSYEAALDGQRLTIQHQPFIWDSRLYIPLDFFENLGYIATTYKNKDNFRYCYLHKPEWAFKFIQGELLSVKATSLEGTHAYILNYPQSVIDLSLQDGNILSANSPFDPKMEAVHKKFQGVQGYNRNEGLQYSEKGWVLQAGRDELGNKYKKYGECKLINNIRTRTGNYGVYEYTNDIKQYLFDTEGKLIGHGEEEQEKGLLLTQADKSLLGAKITSEGSRFPKYLFIEGNNLMLVSNGGYLMRETYIYKNLSKPLVLDLKTKEASVAVLGSALSSSGNYQKLHGEIFSLDSLRNKAKSFDIEISDATDLEVAQTVLSGNKIIFLAYDGAEKYLGYYDLTKFNKGYHRLPVWVTDAQIISLDNQDYLLFRDNQKIYVQQLDFNRDE